MKNVPQYLRDSLKYARSATSRYDDVSDTNIASTSSFLYDPSKFPLKSTQQINVDWTRFENHTFFASAESKVNVAFDKIINFYPFDGERSEIEKFLEDLTGFERYVFDSFPKFRGQLHFSGTKTGEDTDGTKGTWISVKDYTGFLYPELSRKSSGQSVLTPQSSSMTVEFLMKLPEQQNDVQTVFQKFNGTKDGFCLFLSSSASTSECNLTFVVSTVNKNVNVTTPVSKGKFQHIAAIFDRENADHRLKLYVDGQLKATSNSTYIQELNNKTSNFVIGSGTVMNVGTTITPVQTLSASIDEFRVWHSARTEDQIKLYMQKNVFARNDLKLYYRFNEPQPPLAISDVESTNAIVIDSSGNALHSIINDFFRFVGVNTSGNITASYLREAAESMTYERELFNPVLFPAHETVATLNSTLLLSASSYDGANPNLITKLIPEHYLLEGEDQDATQKTSEDVETYGGDGIAGQGQLTPKHVLLTFLYTWAKFFDEIKLYVDSFRNIHYVDYDDTETTPSNFLLRLMQDFGFEFPPMFNDATIEQYVDGENIGPQISTETYALRYVQNQLMKRVLINLPDILRSKGTMHSVRSFLNAVGVDPDNSVKLYEYGGPNQRRISNSREFRREPGVLLQFQTSSYVIGAFLSTSRFEPGSPQIAGQFVKSNVFTPNGISNNVNDGLLTSGSWTLEGVFKFDIKTQKLIERLGLTNQSLMRLETSGTLSGSNSRFIVANVVATSASIEPSVNFYLRTGLNANDKLLKLSIPMSGAGIFDGQKWNVAVGCFRNDEIDSKVSSSYFAYVGKQEQGKIIDAYYTSSFFYEGSNSVLRQVSSQYNASGSYVALGLVPTALTASSLFLNSTASCPSEARETVFIGQAANLRFWSYGMSSDEWKEHVRNFRSVGVATPSKNYNYVQTASGSFQKLRVDTLSKQETRAAASDGTITFLDFSENNNHMKGYNFPVDANCLNGDLFDTSMYTPKFDEFVNGEKVRVRGYVDPTLIEENQHASSAPVYEVLKSEAPTDDVRFGIEFSLVDALNRDMMNMFATTTELESAIGNPELLFSIDYPDLEKLREVYFNRIKEKLNFRAFFDFYHWFDTSMATFIQQLLPYKTEFSGINYVIEPHMFERHKIEYKSNEQYYTEVNRKRINDVLLLQMIEGKLKKF